MGCVPTLAPDVNNHLPQFTLGTKGSKHSAAATMFHIMRGTRHAAQVLAAAATEPAATVPALQGRPDGRGPERVSRI